MVREIWKEVDEYNGLYQVSNLGNVARVDLISEKRTHNISQKTTNAGYKMVDLYFNNIRKNMTVHRLVAIAFIENPNHYRCVNHKDENKLNNNVENLEWCTHKYNSNYGNASQRIGDANSKPVVQKTENGEVFKEYKSAMQAQRETGISNGCINDCIHGKRKTAGGFTWEAGK